MNAQQQMLPFFSDEAPPGRASLVIEAGAGTGKTTRIVREILAILIEKPDLAPERIALVTFTEKAAAEIADRIRYALTDLHASLGAGRRSWPSDSQAIFEVPAEQVSSALAACEAHLGRLDRFRSQTIHSFCQGLLRQYPIEAGLNPSFSVIQGSELTRFNDRVFSAWLRAETAAGTPRAIEDQWQVAIQHLNGIGGIQRTIFSLLSKRDLLEDDSYTLGHVSEAEPVIREWMDRVRAFRDEELEKVRDEQAREIASYLRTHQLPPNASLEEWLEYLEPLAEPLRAVDRRDCGPLKDPMKFLGGDGSGESRRTIHEQLASHRAAVAVRAMTNRFVAFMDAEKRKAGVVDFDDLLLRTRLLVLDERIVRELRAKYDHIFVDEFQDTDRVQATIIDRLSRNDAGRLVPGKTVIVGDPKQAIYSFRRADPETYEQMVESFVREGARKEDLDHQYRSDPQLVTALNSMFARLFATPSSPNVARPQYRTRLIAGRPPDGRSIPARIAFVKARHTPAGADGDEELRLQARVIAERIERDRRRENCDYRRFAILLRRMTVVSPFLDVLERCGIPYSLPPTRLFLERPASVDLLAVLRAIAWPTDRAALISAARTPAFALSDDEIARHFLLAEPSREGSAFTGFEKAIQVWSAESRHLGVLELIDRIVQERGLEDLYAITRSGDEARVCLNRMRDIALEFDLHTGGSLDQFVGEMDRRREESDEADPSWVDEKANAVKILTVHSAKGLEFDTVFLPDLSGRTSNDGVRAYSVEAPRSLLFSGSLQPLAAEYRTSGGLTLKKIGSERNEAELERLFYVAVTRARSEVVFVCDEKQDNTGFWKCVSSIFGAGAKNFPDQDSAVSDLQVGPETVRALFEKIELPPLPDAALSRFVHPLYAELAADRGWAASRTAAPIETPAAVPRLDRGEAARLRAASRNRNSGILLHRFFEVWDGEMGGAAALLAKLGLEIGANPAETERAMRHVEKLVTSATWRTIATASTVGREVPVHYLDSEGRRVEGRIDRLVRVDGRYLVVDYKSGSMDARRAEHDGDQVRRYCAAVSTMTDLPCDGLVWYVEGDEVLRV